MHIGTDFVSMLLGFSIGTFVIGAMSFWLKRSLPNSDRLVEKLESDLQKRQIEEARDRATWFREIQTDLRKIGDETRTLTGLFRSDLKSQGDFGEFVLERLLESAGLTAGVDYTTQESLKGATGDLRPDVRVKLPGERSLIIDSKVTLSAWDRYVRAVTDLEQAEALEMHIANLRRHIHQLAEKHYEKAEHKTEFGSVPVNSPEFVFLFTPVESAWIETLKFEPSLLEEAWAKRVVVVSPSTLFAALKTVGSLWVRERQSSHARELAFETERLFTEFSKYWSELDGVEKDLRKALMRVENARRRSADLARQIESLRLGVGVGARRPTSDEATTL